MVDLFTIKVSSIALLSYVISANVLLSPLRKIFFSRSHPQWRVMHGIMDVSSLAPADLL